MWSTFQLNDFTPSKYFRFREGNLITGAARLESWRKFLGKTLEAFARAPSAPFGIQVPFPVVYCLSTLKWLIYRVSMKWSNLSLVCVQSTLDLGIRRETDSNEMWKHVLELSFHSRSNQWWLWNQNYKEIESSVTVNSVNWYVGDWKGTKSQRNAVKSHNQQAVEWNFLPSGKNCYFQPAVLRINETNGPHTSFSCPVEATIRNKAKETSAPVPVTVLAIIDPACGRQRPTSSARRKQILTLQSYLQLRTSKMS